MNLSIAEIAKAVKGEIINVNDEIKIKNIITDSRKILPDSLFFALKGENVDGHDFVSKAIENGALGVVVETKKNSVKRFGLQYENTAIIAVNDTVQALLDTAKYYKSKIPKIKKTVVAVTGSVGKTTTKEFIYSVLVQKFMTKKSEGNFNTEIGLPFTLFSLGEDTEALVLEMGMSGFGEIQRLSETANPNTAVITNIGTSHIEKLGSREGIKKAKLEILEGMDSDSNIILNADEPLLYSEKNKTGKREYFFGINNKCADFTAEDIKFDYDKNTSEFTVKETNNFRFKIPAAGIHNVYNALPAIITGKIYGLSNEEIQAGFNNFQNAKMRQNIYEFNGITIIDDCYNASLESVRAALVVLSQINKNKKIAVLSDVLESGNYAQEIHRKIGESVVENKIDKVFIFGEKSKTTYETIKQYDNTELCLYFEDKSEIAQALCEEAKKGDVILFKASRGMAVETVIEDFKDKFK